MEASRSTSKGIHQRKEHISKTIKIIQNSKLFNQSWNHVCNTFEPKYLLDYKVLKIINDSTLFLIIPNGKERKTNINDAKPCRATELVENA